MVPDSLLRQIAASCVLLYMLVFFIGTGIWAFLPSQRSARTEASMIPFRNDDSAKTCSGTWETGNCNAAAVNEKGQVEVRAKSR